MTRLLITGARGVVGRALTPYFQNWPGGCVLTDHPSTAGALEPSAITPCDLASSTDIDRMVSRVEPGVVIHLAGSKDVFALENARELAWRSNVETTTNLVEALRGRDVFVAFLSTDYVFAGTDGPYQETSPPRPETEYGRSKLEAERILQASGLPGAIVRSSSLFGFPGDFVSKVKETLGQGQVFSAFSDLVSNPTAISDLAAMLLRIIEGKRAGIFHAAGAEAVSREGFAKVIAEVFGLDAGLIQPATREERVRPADLSLDCSLTYASLGYPRRALADTLRLS